MTDSQVVGRYELLERVGRGAMGELYRANDPLLGREVAVKVLSSDLDIDAATRARFIREGMAAARLQHRNIVTLFEFGEEHDTPFMVMEFLRGQNLAARLAEAAPMPLDQVLDVIVQLCTGLDYAHEQGIVHRDVKPGNIWLQEDGAVKLLDFGIARVAASTLTRHGEVVGSAAYIAPEQVRGLEVDGRADVFSAAVVLFEMLAGRRPFDAETPTAIINLLLNETPAPIDGLPPSVPEGVRRALARALQKTPEKRYARASDFAADLQICALELGLDGATLFGEAVPTVVVEDPGRTIHVPPGSFEVTDLPLHSSGAGAVSSPRKPRPSGTLKAVAAALAAVAVALAGWAFLPSNGNAATAGPPPATEPAASPIVTAAAAAEPAPAPPAEIELASVPSRATILRNGVDSGRRTPAKVLVSDIRNESIRLVLAGHVPVDVDPDDVRDGAQRAVVTLRPVDTPVHVTIRGAYAYQVAVGSRVLAANDAHQFTVQGRQTIRLTASEYFLNRTIQVDPRGGTRQEFSAPALGTLEVRSASYESCMVSIAGREVDYPTVRVSLAAGTYMVRLVKCPDGQTRQQEAIVVAGAPALVKFR